LASLIIDISKTSVGTKLTFLTAVNQTSENNCAKIDSCHLYCNL